MKRYDKALENFTMALDRENQDPVLWHDRADVYLVNDVVKLKLKV
jgi:hypothetical protein